MCQQLECSAPLKSCVQRVIDLLVGNHLEVGLSLSRGLIKFITTRITKVNVVIIIILPLQF